MNYKLETVINKKKPGIGEEWCVICTGTGQRVLPQRIIGPGLVDLVSRTETCTTCGGTGIVSLPPGGGDT